MKSPCMKFTGSGSIILVFCGRLCNVPTGFALVRIGMAGKFASSLMLHRRALGLWLFLFW